jgi:hypothetical protein
VLEDDAHPRDDHGVADEIPAASQRAVAGERAATSRRAVAGEGAAPGEPEDDPEFSPGPLSSAWILSSVVDRLLAMPALTADQVRQRGGDPGDPFLIRLEQRGGSQQWPEFQFAAGGGPLAVVRAINRLLGAAADPVGTADWWLSRNGWLDAQPSLLIGAVADDVLVQAARAIRSEV